ncbi:lasso peptide biosynthesis B2 protein [Streptomyces sp. NRRL WC-3742]|uniref:lasso peptide biosynthesis B2 protein n=1 Tax=Streptomyces sp. NRRL WC-3742 TaxID=1463934 RepID=UPI0004C70317|nr:lasso peptide biosynthesis B2 protein [Streptomyces sp. NRRL WC-3742]
MTSPPCALQPRTRLPLHRRLLPLAAVALARPLARLSPGRLQSVLAALSTGARPGTAAQASAARTAVVAVSLRCAVHNCLQRSIATAVLCRFKGVWPTWQAGVRTTPFGAHAWVEAEGRVIDEPYPDGYFRPMVTVPPKRPARPA